MPWSKDEGESGCLEFDGPNPTPEEALADLQADASERIEIMEEPLKWLTEVPSELPVEHKMILGTMLEGSFAKIPDLQCIYEGALNADVENSEFGSQFASMTQDPSMLEKAQANLDANYAITLRHPITALLDLLESHCAGTTLDVSDPEGQQAKKEMIQLACYRG